MSAAAGGRLALGLGLFIRPPSCCFSDSLVDTWMFARARSCVEKCEQITCLNKLQERNDTGMRGCHFAVQRMPWDMDTSHRSCSEKRWAERGTRPLSERGASQGKYIGCGRGRRHKSMLPTACGRKAERDCGCCAYWQRIWDRHQHPLELPIETGIPPVHLYGVN